MQIYAIIETASLVSADICHYRDCCLGKNNESFNVTLGESSKLPICLDNGAWPTLQQLVTCELKLPLVAEIFLRAWERPVRNYILSEYLLKILHLVKLNGWDLVGQNCLHGMGIRVPIHSWWILAYTRVADHEFYRPWGLVGQSCVWGNWGLGPVLRFLVNLVYQSD